MLALSAYAGATSRERTVKFRKLIDEYYHHKSELKNCNLMVSYAPRREQIEAENEIIMKK